MIDNLLDIYTYICSLPLILKILLAIFAIGAFLFLFKRILKVAIFLAVFIILIIIILRLLGIIVL